MRQNRRPLKAELGHKVNLGNGSLGLEQHFFTEVEYRTGHSWSVFHENCAYNDH